jgi:hypothetical protein
MNKEAEHLSVLFYGMARESLLLFPLIHASGACERSCHLQKVQKQLWKSAEGPLEALLTEIAPSHKTIRREILIGLAQSRYHLNREPEKITEAVEVCLLPQCLL